MLTLALVATNGRAVPPCHVTTDESRYQVGNRRGLIDAYQ